jgi:hypothetical protein
MSDDQTPSPTPRLRRMLDDAIAIAREMGHSHVGVEHVFLAMAGDRDAIPTQVLARMADLDRVEGAVRDVLVSPGYHGQPPPGAIWFPVAELPSLLSTLPRCVSPGVQWGFNLESDQAWIVVSDPGDPGATEAAVTAARDLIAREQA